MSILLSISDGVTKQSMIDPLLIFTSNCQVLKALCIVPSYAFTNLLTFAISVKQPSNWSSESLPLYSSKILMFARRLLNKPCFLLKSPKSPGQLTVNSLMGTLIGSPLASSLCWSEPSDCSLTKDFFNSSHSSKI